MLNDVEAAITQEHARELLRCAERDDVDGAMRSGIAACDIFLNTFEDKLMQPDAASFELAMMVDLKKTVDRTKQACQAVLIHIAAGQMLHPNVRAEILGHFRKLFSTLL